MTSTSALTRLPAAPGAALSPTLGAALATPVTTGLDRLRGADPVDERDELLCLLTVLDLHLAPIDELGVAVRHQHHPTVTRLRALLEDRLLARLRAGSAEPVVASDPDAVVAAVRAIAARGLLPPVYDWVADEAPADALRGFLALEGGPDGGFDDLVAVAQVGLTGAPKVELARNYWDEMGRGDPGAVHTELHHRMARAAALPRLRRQDQPVEALARAALGPLLATSRRRQPELLGALGLIELQAGPRCRKVLAGLRRTGAPDDAIPFYDEHARTDPRHGKDWLEHVVRPLAARPGWATGIVRGARWRATIDARFFAAVARHVGVDERTAPGPTTAAGAR